ncbi:hypothetical protein DY000_02008026 [Brassica cretica]|uniref:Jacalin-type lectin domain-containing protein n=1 Tax=Brassica cretica TaxID=69181 RepID=A0ABQ7CLF1_BRACR|nr:hypothetical protein DY000_02008026 [Brassica cretica]
MHPQQHSGDQDYNKMHSRLHQTICIGGSESGVRGSHARVVFVSSTRGIYFGRGGFCSRQAGFQFCVTITTRFGPGPGTG